MSLHMENPARAARGVPKTDLLARWIVSEDNPPTRLLQVAALTRRCAISTTLAVVIAPLLFGEDAR